jgi:hypothetical protein
MRLVSTTFLAEESNRLALAWIEPDHGGMAREEITPNQRVDVITKFDDQHHQN